MTGEELNFRLETINNTLKGNPKAIQLVYAFLSAYTKTKCKIKEAV